MDSPENNQTFLEHLEELRRLLFRIMTALAVLFLPAFFFTDDLIKFLVKYSCPPDFTLRYFSPMEPLFVKIKISLLAAFFLGLPYIAYAVWKFVVPGLYPREQLRVKQLALFSWLLFAAGALFCFSFIIPALMRFSLGMQSAALQPAIGLNNYIGLAGMLLLGFGIMFQLPIIVVFLVLSGMLRLETVKKLRGVILIVIFALAALLTPPDIFSQLMMAVPAYLLFELSLLISSLALRSRKTPEIEIVGDSPEPEHRESDFFPVAKPEDAEIYPEYYRRAAQKRKIRYIPRR
ncbi:MAG: twin-arginine translocase subunit TatC [Victivallaceae bacterium]|nr:twin-arginine translocase subunit TatC [Victivallaceae bacterium]